MTSTKPSLSANALLTKLNEAVTAVSEAEKTAEAAKAELVSRSRVVGELLLEAKKLHPKVADFEAFLKRVKGLQRSRAYDLMRLVGGRITDERLRQDARERQRESRAKRKKLPEPKPIPANPGPTFRDKPHVTESQEVSIEERRAQNAELNLSAEERAAAASTRALTEFITSCRLWLPKITVEADRLKARQYVAELTHASKAEAA
jgi:hypothetical protein